ncbi:rho-related GTP-binding protein RhoD [Vombatus ursinus]|uniref:Ras homolog family member D n=1 Tax=Vombatus ursinus TaxID=29139 RepID=A0A4X2JT07_VOMUR|nr:rho-related GTP-binding protein RhoD [Vombatus ursinus]
MQRDSEPQPSEPAVPTIKVVLVGDGGCGKTSLLMVFAKGKFPETYVPTVFERYSMALQLDGKPVNLYLWDTAGQEDYDRLRPLSYADAQVVLMCYDVMSPNSFDNILSKWYPEVTHFCPGVPIILVGCKTDLRKDKVLLKKLRQNRQEPITYQKGQTMARSVRAVTYVECSAWLQDNIPSIFHEAAVAALSSRKRRRRRQRGAWKGCLVT